MPHPVPFQDCLDDVIGLAGGQLGKHGQAYAAGGIALGVGKGAGDAGRLAPRVTFLLVNGDGIVTLGVDAVGGQEIQQRVAMLRLLRLDDIQMIDVVVTGRFVGKLDVGGVTQARGVARGPLAAQGVPFVEVLSTWR